MRVRTKTNEKSCLNLQKKKRKEKAIKLYLVFNDVANEGEKR